MMRSRAISLFAILLVLAPVFGLCQATKVDLSIFSGMKYRQIGPFRGGRSVAVSGVYDQPEHFYMGTTGGGLYKSTDTGENWVPVSDGFFKTGIVGAIGVARTNGNIVYVGMGETPIRGNISHGDGVYKTEDGGKTWTHMGLKETQYISRVLVHPKDPNTVWVAALGPVFGPSPERGIFKSTDGGKSWKKTLFVSNKAGAIDLDFDPNNPDVMIAATWEAWRTPYGMNSGGPGSRIFQTKNGGETWTDITSRPGLPTGMLGKIGLCISPANPNRYYAIIEAEARGVYRSDDAGQTWKLMSSNPNLLQRPWYYMRIHADPKDENAVYVSNVGFHKSTDGGTNWRGVRTQHSDNHDLWIDPNDPKRMINGNDGGANVTVDGGQNWSEQDFATAQIYHVSTDNAFPYNILGAQQDNSTIRIPSRARGALDKDSWTSTAGGESGYVAAKPDDPDIVFGGSYGGDLSWRNHRTGVSRSVDPWPDNPMGHGAGDLEHRFQWTFPIVFSPHNPNVLYTGSQYVLRSTDMGESWTKISPDLSRNDKSRQGPSGGPLTKDNTSVEYYCTVFTIAESPKRGGVIWAGSDDGLVHITQNGGRTWMNVTPKDAPDWGLVSLIEASPHNPATAFAAINNYKNNDHKPYIYRTDDYGKTWTKIVNGIGGTFVRAVRQDPVNPDLLFAGTENGVYVSFDGGKAWQDLRLNLPFVPVHDLVIKEGDLVLATHGRSFYVLDDISPLRQATLAMAKAGNYVFEPRNAYRVRWGSSSTPSATATVGANPLSGAVVNFYLKKAVANIDLQVLDSKGEEVNAGVRTVRGQEGFNQVALWMTYPSYKSIPGGVFWGAFPSPVLAPPGEYTLKMKIDGEEFVRKFRWMCDPRSNVSDADVVEQFNLSMKVIARTTEANQAVLDIRALKAQIEDRVGKNASLKPDADSLSAKLTAIEDELHQGKSKSGQDPLNYPIRLNNKLAALAGFVQSGERRPPKQSYDVFNDLSKKLQVQLDALKAVLSKDLADFNRKVKAAGLDEVKTG
ncbi:MAG: hypothetical protein KF784_02105 [Fimbriimonadaceae bacterium]|nr:hypothetical protein [Fimbriimonadaceae bacterium]